MLTRAALSRMKNSIKTKYFCTSYIFRHKNFLIKGKHIKNIIDLMRRFITECTIKHKNMTVEIILMLT